MNEENVAQLIHLDDNDNDNSECMQKDETSEPFTSIDK